MIRKVFYGARDISQTLGKHIEITTAPLLLQNIISFHDNRFIPLLVINQGDTGEGNDFLPKIRRFVR